MNKVHKLLNQMLSNFYLIRLQRNQWQDQAYLKREQFKKLKVIIKFAYNYVPFYHRLFRSAGVKPEDIKRHEDLAKIPPVTKQDIRENYHDFIARGLDVSRLPSSFTSGSTGIPLRLVYDPLGRVRIGASERYPYVECGVKTSDNFVTVWGRGSRTITFGRKYVKFLGSFSETIVPIFQPEKLANLLRELKPDVINTFPSIISMLGDYDVSGINPRLIFTQGEIVTPHCRYVAKKLFNSELFETYGSVEFGQLAFECEEHAGLHLITDIAYVEFISKDGEHVSPGETGEIIVTGLCNTAMPLIRYKIGDIGVPSAENCSCGRKWPMVKSIEGRLNDFLILPSGKRLSWLYILRHILYDKQFQKNIFNISQYQVVQEDKGKLILRVVKKEKLDTKILENIKSNMEMYFSKIGEKIEITVEIVKEIPSERTGKRKLFISKISS
jgi:phenylacetate-CoA ligase